MSKVKELFVGWYDYSNTEFKNILKKGKISLDSNILLYLYKISTDSSQEILERFDEIKDRLIFSYYTAFEVTKNRKKVESDSLKEYETMRQGLDKKFKDLLSEFNKIPSNKFPKKDQLIKSITRENEKMIKEFDAELEKKEKLYKDGLEDKICNLISDNIIDKFDDKTYEIEKKEGKRRFENKIPPGYMDSDKNENGDYYIFKQLINYSSENNCDMIFVTEDNKEDMFCEYRGIKSPRPELMQEFYEKTGHRILILSLPKFINNETIFSKKISEEALDEIKYFSNINGYYMPKLFSRLKKFYSRAFIYNDYESILLNIEEIKKSIRTILRILSSSGDNKTISKLTTMLTLLEEKDIEQYLLVSADIRENISHIKITDFNNVSYYKNTLDEKSNKLQLISFISEMVNYVTCYLNNDIDEKNYVAKLRAIRDSLNSDVISIADAYDELVFIYNEIFLGETYVSI